MRAWKGYGGCGTYPDRSVRPHPILARQNWLGWAGWPRLSSRLQGTCHPPTTSSLPAAPPRLPLPPFKPPPSIPLVPAPSFLLLSLLLIHLLLPSFFGCPVHSLAVGLSFFFIIIHHLLLLILSLSRESVLTPLLFNASLSTQNTTSYFTVVSSWF